jgi:hypothetical protein
MRIVETDYLKGIFRFARDLDRQTEGDRLTLTILDVLQIVGEGCIDINGSRTEEARRVKRPSRKSSRDPSGYWDLTQGAYWVSYNETVQIRDGSSLVLQPHKAIMINGLWHPTLIVRDWAEVSGILLVVSAKGVRVMENSPLSTGFIIESK